MFKMKWLWVFLLGAVVVSFQNCALEPAPKAEFGANSMSSSSPDFTFSKTPSSVSASSQSLFEFAAPAAGISFECSLNGATYGRCASPVTLANLPDGAYTYFVRAKNGVGKTFELTYSWTVDHAAPTVLIGTSISFTNLRNLSVGFTGADQGSTVISFECRVDSLAFAPCTSPYAVSNLAAGSHTVQIRGKDAAGNQSAAATLSWTIDLTVPQLNVTAAPPGGDDYRCEYGVSPAVFAFTTADAGGSGFKNTTCKLDNGAEEVCTSGKTYSISTIDNIGHTVTIKATDNAGNVTTFTRPFRLLYTDCNPPPFDPGGGGGVP